MIGRAHRSDNSDRPAIDGAQVREESRERTALEQRDFAIGIANYESTNNCSARILESNVNHLSSQRWTERSPASQSQYNYTRQSHCADNHVGCGKSDHRLQGLRIVVRIKSSHVRKDPKNDLTG